ncbi:MAG: hypothetical protein KatS3mg124_2391 [Porticoccaceae bacterium]|nr:MAG: hypothetical protein KatS3mg124_2391 [Porticoccaceae bacterium]
MSRMATTASTLAWAGLSEAGLALLATLLIALAAPAAAGDPEGDFVHAHLGDKATPGVLWLHGDLRERAAAVLGHPFRGLRVRYFGAGQKTVWILDEIGKELPITIGVAVEGRRILEVRVLRYRESRGGEVRHPFFTDQFRGAALVEGDRLDRAIDGITGATLSVAAVRKVATLALLFHAHTPYGAAR